MGEDYEMPNIEISTIDTMGRITDGMPDPPIITQQAVALEVKHIGNDTYHLARLKRFLCRASGWRARGPVRIKSLNKALQVMLDAGYEYTPCGWARICINGRWAKK